MKKVKSFILLLVLFVSACTPMRPPVPPGAIPQGPGLTAAEARQGAEARRALLAQFPQAGDPAQFRFVRGILDRLLVAAGNEPRHWQLTLLEDKRIANAAATRGNQIFVWTGMLNATPDAAQLAAVLGHEIAHVIAGHVVPTPQETINNVLANLSGNIVSGLISRSTTAAAGAGIGGSLATQAVKGFIVNPYSKRLELEADQIGLFLMAEAGYDPRAALAFWRRTSTNTGRLEQFISTHPTSGERIEQLTELMPQALERLS